MASVSVLTFCCGVGPSVAANQKVLVDGFGAGRGIGEVSVSIHTLLKSTHRKHSLDYSRSLQGNGVVLYSLGCCFHFGCLASVRQLYQDGFVEVESDVDVCPVQSKVWGR